MRRSSEAADLDVLGKLSYQAEDPEEREQQYAVLARRNKRWIVEGYFNDHESAMGYARELKNAFGGQIGVQPIPAGAGIGREEDIVLLGGLGAELEVSDNFAQLVGRVRNMVSYGFSDNDIVEELKDEHDSATLWFVIRAVRAGVLGA